MEVRRAQPGDEHAMAEVHVRTWQAAYRGQVPDRVLDGLSVERRRSTWSQIIAASSPPADDAFVLADHGQICGFVHIAPSRDGGAGEEVGELTAIYVAPEFWGSGGGALLMERALAGLREARFLEATLWVLETNVRARRFYEAMGWVPDGAVKVDARESFELHEVRYRSALR